MLLAASIAANAAVLPYALSLGALRAAEPPVSLPVAIVIQILQATLFFAIAIFTGLFLGQKVGLGAPIIGAWLRAEPIRGKVKPILRLSCVLGIVVAIAVFVLDRFVFSIFVEPITPFQAAHPLWQRMLACFYGAIGEEIGLRLFIMTVFVWLTYKIARTKNNEPTAVGVWLSIILVSVVFGLGHLPMTSLFMEITAAVVARAIILNGIAGMVFGWLYWNKGLESAMISHFSADIVLHVLLPSLIYLAR